MCVDALIGERAQDDLGCRQVAAPASASISPFPSISPLVSVSGFGKKKGHSGPWMSTSRRSVPLSQQAGGDRQLQVRAP